MDIPQIGLGTWPLTGAECTAAVASALEIGYRHLDTAENYRNEDAVGAAVAASGIPRGEVFVTSKFNKGHHGSVDSVRAAAEASLERMGLEYLDLFLMHWPNPDLGRYVQTCDALAELASETGIIRSWGVSNLNVAQLGEVLDAGLVPSVNQIHSQPGFVQREVQRANSAAGVATSAYSPLGRGSALSGQPVITEIAERHGRTPAQVVLRWHLQQGRIVLPRSGNPDRQRENLDVGGFELTEQELAAVDGLDSPARPDSYLDSEEFGH